MDESTVLLYRVKKVKEEQTCFNIYMESRNMAPMDPFTG